MAESPGTPASETTYRAWWAGPWPLVIVFVAWSFFFYTRNQTHPFYYEKDAPTKVEQVVSGERNFFHPLLMLNTTDAAMRMTGAPRTEQEASNVGHIVMAIFGAVSVGAFVLFGFHCGGWFSALAVGVFLGLNDLMLTLTHYFKEDPALLVGLALSFLAMKFFHECPTLPRAAWLGAACAVAISGKYVGLAALILALPLVLVPPGPRLARLGVMLGVGLVVLLAIDWQWVVHFSALRAGIHSEMHDLLGRDEMVKKVPHIQQVIETYRSDLPIFVGIGVLLQIAHLVGRGGRRRPVEWMLVVYPLVFTVILAWSPRLFERHFLPVFICLWVSSGLGWVNAIRWIWQKFPRLPAWSIAVGTLAAVACAGRLPRNFFHRHHELGSDHRALLAEWIRENVPADAVIAQDRRVFLENPDGSPRPDLGLPQRIVTEGWLSDIGTLAELRKRGVTHVAMHMLDSGRFMHGGKLAEKPSPTGRDGRDSPDRRTFYSDLEAHAQRVWERKDGADGAMNPGLLFYRARSREVRSGGKGRRGAGGRPLAALRLEGLCSLRSFGAREGQTFFADSHCRIHCRLRKCRS